jgi:hypothetical protein
MLIALIILGWLLINTWIMLAILVAQGCIIEGEEIFYIALGAVLSPLVLALIELILDKLNK